MLTYLNIPGRMTRLIRGALLLGLLVSLNACVVQAPARPGDPAYAPVMGPGSLPPSRTDGSLYQGNFSLSLFGDSKAAKVGDIVTIVLQEQTSSKKTTNVGVTKKSKTDFGQDSGTGTLGTVLGSKPGLGSLSMLTDIQHDRDFSGSGDADQSNSLSGDITVTVADVLPNGNLVVRGEKWMTLNRGDEFIQISGIVRPEDITPKNTVLSTQLANARITYSGTGEVADAGAMGWLSRFFNSAIWPF